MEKVERIARIIESEVRNCLTHLHTSIQLSDKLYHFSTLSECSECLVRCHVTRGANHLMS